MAVLVTGGAGFIGSHLLDRLASHGADAVCWDNFNDAYDPRVKRANIAPLIESGKVRLYEGDICDPVLGEEIDKKVFVVHHGVKVYFCCEGCDTDFKKNPDKYIPKLPVAMQEAIKAGAVKKEGGRHD